MNRARQGTSGKRTYPGLPAETVPRPGYSFRAV